MRNPKGRLCIQSLYHVYSYGWWGTSIYTPKCPSIVLTQYLWTLPWHSSFLSLGLPFELSRKLPVLFPAPSLRSSSLGLLRCGRGLIFVVCGCEESHARLCIWRWIAHTGRWAHHRGQTPLIHYRSRGMLSLGWMGRSSRYCSECDVHPRT